MKLVINEEEIPTVGDFRVVKKFALFPVKTWVSDLTCTHVWFERYYSIEYFSRIFGWMKSDYYYHSGQKQLVLANIRSRINRKEGRDFTATNVMKELQGES